MRRLLPLLLAPLASCGEPDTIDVPRFEHARHTWMPRQSQAPASIDEENALVLLYETIATGPGVASAVFSWNIDLPPDSFAVAEVATRDGPFLLLTSWGELPSSHEAVTTTRGARVAIDELILKEPTPQITLRVRAFSSIRTAAPPGNAVLHRADLTLTRPRSSPVEGGPPKAVGALDVPFRMNDHANDELRSRLCSPISLAMLLEHRGASAPLDEIAAIVHDPEHDIYGNWPRAIQTAFELGVPGYLTRFGDWREVARHLASTGPLAISITVEPGELRGAPYDETAGHLIVLYGLDETGGALVIDPAVSEEGAARRVYRQDDLTRVWLSRKRGTAYALLDPADG